MDGVSIACSSSCPFCQFFTITRAGGDSLHCGISTGRRPHMPPVSAGISKAHSRLRLRDLRLGGFAIDDKFEFGRAGTPEPSGRSSLSEGGNVFAVSVASSLAEAEQRQAGGHRAPNPSFVEYRALQNRRSGGRRASLGCPGAKLSRPVFSTLFQLHPPSVRRSSPLPKAVPSIH